MKMHQLRPVAAMARTGNFSRTAIREAAEAKGQFRARPCKPSCAGLGISLVPAMAWPADEDRHLAYRPLKWPRSERKIVVVWPKQRPPGRTATEFPKLISASVEKTRC